MQHVQPLPTYLIQRYRDWKDTTYEKSRGLLKHLASDGQHPRAMIISCCDSRVLVTSIFGAEPGDFFVHRNIASLVPPYETEGDCHGTSAAIEYAVSSLKVAHLLIIGHSNCGGVAGCHAMCSGNAPELEEKSSFVGRWMDILRPGFERVHGKADDEIRALEKEAVLISLENLMTFPFVKSEVESGQLSLHGLWTDIGDGGLQHYDNESGEFKQI
ncbi:MAG: carbonic anhydrase [Boseongicola sp.]